MASLIRGSTICSLSPAWPGRTLVPSPASSAGPGPPSAGSMGSRSGTPRPIVHPGMGSAAEVAPVPGRGRPTENLIPVFIDYKLKKSPLSKRIWFRGWACLDNAALRSEGGFTPNLCLEFKKTVFLKLNIDSEKNL